MKGAREIGSTVLSMSMSLVAVFIPILLMGGIIGRLFREFAVVLSVTILVSLAVSLTATPMMCSRAAGESKKTHGKCTRRARGCSTRILEAYGRALAWVLEHSLLVLVHRDRDPRPERLALRDDPQGILSPAGHRRASTATSSGTRTISFQAMQERISALAEIVQAGPRGRHGMIFTGGGGGTTTNTGRVFIALKPLGERKATADQIINRLRPKLADGARARRCSCRPCRTCASAAGIGAAQYQYTIQSADLDDLNHWARCCSRPCKGIRQLTDVNSDAQNNGLSAKLVIDRATAARFGITPQTHRQRRSTTPSASARSPRPIRS